MVPLRQELNRTKDALNKERMARQSMTQEIQMLKEQYARLEQAKNDLERENKSIPAINESNEILKNDLNSLRKRYKEEKSSMQKHIKMLEGQTRDVDSIKTEVRNLAMRLMEVSSGGVPSNTQANMNVQQQQAQQQSQQANVNTRYDPTRGQMTMPNNTSYYNPPPPTNITYTMSQNDFEDDYDDYDAENPPYSAGDGGLDSDYDNNSFVDDGSIMSSALNSSLESNILPPNLNNNTNNQNMLMMMSSTDNLNGIKKKKKVKKQGTTSMRSSSGNNPVHMMQSMQSTRSDGGGLASSVSLPRIH